MDDLRNKFFVNFNIFITGKEHMVIVAMNKDQNEE